MSEFSTLSQRIPTFVKKYLNLKHNDEVHWDRGVKNNVKYYRLIKKDYNTTGRIDLPRPPAIEKEEVKKKKRDVQVHTA
jgi:hypothetical protein